jgi:FkbM family methyltransferase
MAAIDSLLNRMIFFVNLRIGSFIAKLFGKEPHVSWRALFREHFIEYPYFKVLGFFKDINEIHYEEANHDDSIKLIKIADYKIYWPKTIPHEPVISAYKSVLYNEADNYFRFYSPQKDDIVFDLGACEGFFSLYLRNKVRKVYVFEPFPELCGALSLTLSEDIQRGSAEICNYAVGNREGVVDFFVDDDLDGSTVESHRINNTILKEISVPMIALDKFVSDRGIDRVSMIKMDVEGAEYSVLEGARKVIKEFKPDLLVSAYHYPHDYERLAQLLINSNYNIYLGPLVMTTQHGQGRPWYRYALIHATAEK